MKKIAFILISLVVISIVTACKVEIKDNKEVKETILYVNSKDGEALTTLEENEEAIIYATTLYSDDTTETLDSSCIFITGDKSAYSTTTDEEGKRITLTAREVKEDCEITIIAESKGKENIVSSGKVSITIIAKKEVEPEVDKQEPEKEPEEEDKKEIEEDKQQEPEEEVKISSSLLAINKDGLLEITCPTENATIYYSTTNTDNWSETQKIETKYIGAINISEARIVKAVAKIEEKESEVVEKRIWKVSFDLRGGTEEGIKTISVLDGEKVKEPPAPSKKDYDFIGYDYDFTKEVTEDLTVTAKWKEDDKKEDDKRIEIELKEDTNIANLSIIGDREYIFSGKITGEQFKALMKKTTSDNLTTPIVMDFSNCLITDDIPDSNDYDSSIIPSNACISTLSLPKGLKKIPKYFTNNKDALKEIIIPDTVTSIEEDAFLGCSSLTSITLPNSVTSIGGSAFSGCSSLTSITLPNRVTYIGNEAFMDCTSLTSITLPSSIIHIGGSAFSGCSSLTSVTIPEGVTSIEVNTFSRCTALTSITLPATVTSMENNVFYGWKATQTITVPWEEGSKPTKWDENWNRYSEATIIYNGGK